MRSHRSGLARVSLLAALLCSSQVPAATVTYAITLGNNAPPASAEGADLPALRFADDDAVRYDAFFSRFASGRWLLTVLDVDTQRRYPEAVARAQPPTLRALRTVIVELAAAMQADLARGDTPVLYVTYSGHGVQGDDGAVFLVLADGPLTRQVLYDELFTATPAAFIHLIVDACHAEAVVGSRGLFAKERDASTSKLTDDEVATVRSNDGLRRFPHVGVLMATTAEQQSHEWGQYQSGIFTHEVLSGLSGAADVNGDDVVEYSELQAFAASAGREVRDPRALAQVIAFPPALDPHAPLVNLKHLRGVTLLVDDFSTLGHFFIELEGGERYLDAHLSGAASLAVPAERRAFLVWGEQEADLGGRERTTGRLADLRFVRRSSAARGSLETSFRASLFAAPFGATYYSGFVDSAKVPSVIFRPRDRPLARGGTARTPLAVAALAVGGAALITAGVFGGLALDARNDFERTDLQRSAADANARFKQHSLGAAVSAGVAVAFALAGWALWPPGDGPRVTAVVGHQGASVMVAGGF
jgi:hypothetical protein